MYLKLSCRDMTVQLYRGRDAKLLFSCVKVWDGLEDHLCREKDGAKTWLYCEKSRSGVQAWAWRARATSLSCCVVVTRDMESHLSSCGRGQEGDRWNWEMTGTLVS